MNINIESYMNDGANWQAQCVLACLRAQVGAITELAWDANAHRSDAEVVVGRYENCREQGYVFSLQYEYKTILHIAVYEHRNSDNLIVIVFKANVINTPNVDVVMKDRGKYDYTKSFKCGQIEECTEYIVDKMKEELLFAKTSLQDKFKKLVNDYGKDGELATFEYCSDYGVECDGSTIDKIVVDGDNVYLYYNENTNDYVSIADVEYTELNLFYCELLNAILTKMGMELGYI